MTREKTRGRRSDCPVNFLVEVFGDRWSLLIVRDIVFFGKKTYGEFLKSDERIATNILSARLTLLEREGVLRKTPHPTDKRKDVYELTEKGLDLIPMLFEIVEWSARHGSQKESAPERPAEKARREFIERVRRDKKRMIEHVKKVVRNGGFVFSGD